MAYTDFEEGPKGNPVELYQFRFKSDIFTYTSGDREIDYSGAIYTPHPITRSKIICGRSRNDGSISIEVEPTSPLATPFLKGPPASSIELTIFRFHRSDQSDVIVYWQGEILGASLDENCVSLEGFSCIGLLAREGLRTTFSSQCNHFLYGPACGLSVNSFTQELTVVAISADGLQFQVNHGQADPDYYNGGILSRGDGFCEHREIRVQDGNTLSLGLPIRGFTVGETVRIAPGCDRYGSTCQNKFNNYDNFGGFEAQPNRDPHIDFGKNNTSGSSELPQLGGIFGIVNNT